MICYLLKRIGILTCAVLPYVKRTLYKIIESTCVQYAYATVIYENLILVAQRALSDETVRR